MQPISRSGRKDPHERPSARWLLVPLVLAAAFGVIAFAVQRGISDGLDQTILMAFRGAQDPSQPIGPAWFQELARDVTALGSVTILASLAIVVLGYSIVARRSRSLPWMIVSIAGAEALNIGLKHLFDRPRPDIQHAARVFTSSFPSGHALMSAAVFLTFALVLSRRDSHSPLRVYCVSCAIVIAAIIGLSRVYLGLHFPSDVGAGWCVGLAWATLCWLAFAWSSGQNSYREAAPPAR